MEARVSMAVLAVLLFVSVATCNGNSRCRFPPKFWCEDVSIAKDCGVLEQCQDFHHRDSQAGKPVEFGVYYESYCPGCRDLLLEQLFPTYNKIGHIMNVTLVPYGNAEEVQSASGWQYTCQHGEKECVGNLIETCTLAKTARFSDSLKFINCFERAITSGTPVNVARKCASKLKVENIEDILNCSTSAEGNKLEHEMAVKTESLNPPHQYTPWVTLNGVHTDAINQKAQTDLLSLICDTYTGSPKPKACTQTKPEMRRSRNARN